MAKTVDDYAIDFIERIRQVKNIKSGLGATITAYLKNGLLIGTIDKRWFEVRDYKDPTTIYIEHEDAKGMDSINIYFLSQDLPSLAKAWTRQVKTFRIIFCFCRRINFLISIPNSTDNERLLAGSGCLPIRQITPEPTA